MQRFVLRGNGMYAVDVNGYAVFHTDQLNTATSPLPIPAPTNVDQLDAVTSPLPMPANISLPVESLLAPQDVPAPAMSTTTSGTNTPLPELTDSMFEVVLGEIPEYNELMMSESFVENIFASPVVTPVSASLSPITTVSAPLSPIFTHAIESFTQDGAGFTQGYDDLIRQQQPIEPQGQGETDVCKFTKIFITRIIL